MSVTVTHQGRRAKIALGSAHVAVREVVARAKAHFGLEGSFGLRTTRGRRADVPDAAAWAHTGLSNCELELVRRAGGGGGAVRAAAAVSRMGSARGPCRSRSTRARRWPRSSSAWWPRAPAAGPAAPRRRSGSCGIDSRARTSGGRSGISATAAARPCASTWNWERSPTAPRRPRSGRATRRHPPLRRRRRGQSLRRPQGRHNPQRRSRPLRAAAVRAAAVRALAASATRFPTLLGWRPRARRAATVLWSLSSTWRRSSANRASLACARSAPGTGVLRAASRRPAASRCSPLSDSEERRGGEPWLVLCDAGARDAARLTRALDMLRPLAAPGLRRRPSTRSRRIASTCAAGRRGSGAGGIRRPSAARASCGSGPRRPRAPARRQTAKFGSCRRPPGRGPRRRARRRPRRQLATCRAGTRRRRQGGGRARARPSPGRRRAGRRGRCATSPRSKRRASTTVACSGSSFPTGACLTALPSARALLRSLRRRRRSGPAGPRLLALRGAAAEGPPARRDRKPAGPRVGASRAGLC